MTLSALLVRSRNLSRVVRGLALSTALVVVGVDVFAATAHAEETIELRMATLAPKGSAWDRIYRAWDASLRKASGGRLGLRMYPGGVAGDETDYIRKIRAEDKSGQSQLDGASLTAAGLGRIVRPVLVLQLPGLFLSYEQIDGVRKELSKELEQQFESHGYKFLGWGDAGRARLFSKEPVRKPDDLRKTRPWVWREEPVFSQFLKVAGANGVRIGLPEVFPALNTGMVDAVPASALATVALQWFTKVKYVTKQADSVLIGATIMRKDRFDALPPDLQKILLDTSLKAHDLLNKRIREDDDKAYKTLLERGITEIDTSAYTKEWEAVAQKTREELVGKLYDRPLLDRVTTIARRYGTRAPTPAKPAAKAKK